MPNHVINEVVLHGVSLERAAPLITGKDRSIDFAVLLPLPLNFWPGSVGRAHEEAFPGTHLEAARKTWGTKWNAYGIDEGGRYVSVREDGGSTVLTFQTANGHPRGWTVALFNTLTCDITASWLDEGQAEGFRESYRSAGPDKEGANGWDYETIPEGTDEHRRLHKLLWGVEAHEDEEDEGDGLR